MSGLANGYYCVTVTDLYDPACTEELCVEILCDSSGKSMVNNISKQMNVEEYNIKASIYPNPSSGIFNLEIENQSSFYSVCVMDLFGKLIYQVDGVEKDLLQIDLSEQPRGMYFVKVISEDRSVEMKVIKQ